MSARGGLVARLARSRIYVNAYALVLNQVTSAGLGFLYWMLAARLYGVKVVGVSSAAISTLLLISGVAQLGLNAGMYRFVPRAGRHARKLIVWSYVVTIVAGAVFGVAVMWFLETVKPGWLSLEGMTPAVADNLAVSFQPGVPFDDAVPTAHTELEGGRRPMSEQEALQGDRPRETSGARFRRRYPVPGAAGFRPSRAMSKWRRAHPARGTQSRAHGRGRRE